MIFFKRLSPRAFLALAFGADHLDYLTPSGDKIGQQLRGFVRQGSQRRLRRLNETKPGLEPRLENQGHKAQAGYKYHVKRRLKRALELAIFIPRLKIFLFSLRQ